MTMPVNSALKLKLDELFLRWLTDRATQKVLRENLIQVKAGQSLEAMLALPTGIVVGPMSASFYGCLYSPSYMFLLPSTGAGQLRLHVQTPHHTFHNLLSRSCTVLAPLDVMPLHPVVCQSRL